MKQSRTIEISCLSKTYLSRSSLTTRVRPRREEIHDKIIIYAKEDDVLDDGRQEASFNRIKWSDVTHLFGYNYKKCDSKKRLIFLIRDGDHCYAIRRVAVHLADSRKVARHLLGEHMANIA